MRTFLYYLLCLITSLPTDIHLLLFIECLFLIMYYVYNHKIYNPSVAEKLKVVLTQQVAHLGDHYLAFKDSPVLNLLFTTLHEINVLLPPSFHMLLKSATEFALEEDSNLLRVQGAHNDHLQVAHDRQQLTGSYFGMPKIRDRPVYEHVDGATPSAGGDSCNKTSSKHQDQSGGVVVLWCP